MRGTFSGGPQKKNCRGLESSLGSPLLGKIIYGRSNSEMHAVVESEISVDPSCNGRTPTAST